MNPEVIIHLDKQPTIEQCIFVFTEVGAFFQAEKLVKAYLVLLSVLTGTAPLERAVSFSLLMKVGKRLPSWRRVGLELWVGMSHHSGRRSPVRDEGWGNSWSRRCGWSFWKWVRVGSVGVGRWSMHSHIPRRLCTHWCKITLRPKATTNQLLVWVELPHKKWFNLRIKFKPFCALKHDFRHFNLIWEGLVGILYTVKVWSGKLKIWVDRVTPNKQLIMALEGKILHHACLYT